MVNVKRICKQKGISQAELAERLGISPSALNQRISGNPTLDKIEETAKALGVPISDLFIRPDEEAGFVCPNCGTRLKITEDK